MNRQEFSKRWSKAQHVDFQMGVLRDAIQSLLPEETEVAPAPSKVAVKVDELAPAPTYASGDRVRVVKARPTIDQDGRQCGDAKDLVGKVFTVQFPSGAVCFPYLLKEEDISFPAECLEKVEAEGGDEAYWKVRELQDKLGASELESAKRLRDLRNASAELAAMTKERDEAVRLNDAWKHTADRCADTVDQRIASAVAAEREACALACMRVMGRIARVDEAFCIDPGWNAAESCLRDIRARGAAKGESECGMRCSPGDGDHIVPCRYAAKGGT